MQAANEGIRILFWSEITSAYPCKPKISPLLAELFGLFPLVAYNCWQTVKTDALSLFRGVGTANYSTNNHLPISQQFTQHEYFTQYGSEYLHLVYQYGGQYHVHVV